ASCASLNFFAVEPESLVPGRGWCLRTSEPIEYQCLLLDSYGRVVWRSKFFAPTDSEAIATARTFLRDRIDSTSVFEPLQGRRYIGCENDAIILELGATQPTRRLAPDAR